MIHHNKVNVEDPIISEHVAVFFINSEYCCAFRVKIPRNVTCSTFYSTHCTWFLPNHHNKSVPYMTAICAFVKMTVIYQ